MPNVLIHKASELKAETRVALEAELGRSLQDDEKVSIMTFVPHAAPTGEARTEAGRKLQDHFNRIDQKLKGAPEEEAEEALDEAIRKAVEILEFAAKDWSDLSGDKFPAPRTIDQLHTDPDFQERVADAVIAAVPFRAGVEAAA